MDDFYVSIRSMTKRILTTHKKVIANTRLAESPDYLRKPLIDEFGNQFSGELIDGILTFHNTRGQSPFLIRKLKKQNKLDFGIRFHRKAVKHISLVDPDCMTRFKVVLRLLSKEKGRDIDFIVSTSEEYGKSLLELINKGEMPRNPLIKRTTRKKKDVLILTLDTEREIIENPDLFVGIDMNVDSIDFAFMDPNRNVLDTKKLLTGFREFDQWWTPKYARLQSQRKASGNYSPSRRMKRLLRLRQDKKRQVLDAVIHLIRENTKEKTFWVRIEALDFNEMKRTEGLSHWVKRTFNIGGALKRMLENQWIVQEVNPRNTSRTCSNCAHVHKQRGDQHTFTCEKCKLVMDSHLNAAIIVASDGVKAFQKFLKGRHGATLIVPPPLSTSPEGGRRGLENEDSGSSQKGQSNLDEYIRENHFGPHSECGKSETTEVPVEQERRTTNLGLQR